MTKTVRVSEEVYEALDRKKGEDERFNDIVKTMAEELGIIHKESKSLKTLTTKLDRYGFNEEDIHNVLEALRYVYTGKEAEKIHQVTTGSPNPHNGVSKKAADQKYESQIDALKRKNLVKENPKGQFEHSDAEPGYRCTEIDNKIGSEAVDEFLRESHNEIKKLLGKYPPTKFAFFIKFGFYRTDTGHLSTKKDVRKISRASGQDGLLGKIWDIGELENITKEYKDFREELWDRKLAAKVSGARGTLYVLPPEFEEYLERVTIELKENLKRFEIYQIVENYFEGLIESRDQVLEELTNATEKDLDQQLQTLNQKGITSKYLKEEPPFLIKDRDLMIELIEENIKK